MELLHLYLYQTGFIIRGPIYFLKLVSLGTVLIMNSIAIIFHCHYQVFVS